MSDSNLWTMLAVVFILVVLFVVFVIGDIPEGYEDEERLAGYQDGTAF